MDQVHKLFSSGALSLLQIDLGTTPNMAPPSNLKNPVSIEYNFIMKAKVKIQNLGALICRLFLQSEIDPDKTDRKKYNQTQY